MSSVTSSRPNSQTAPLRPARGRAKSLLRAFAKRVIFQAIHPGFLLKPVYRVVFYAHWYAREIYEWAWRSLVATPVFLARCEKYGTGISIDRIPYLNGKARIELGDQFRVSGQLNIHSSNTGEPRLKIGNGVFIGHATRIGIAERIEIGDFTSIGSGCQIADTEGHSHYNPQRPIWEVPATADDIAPVIIEDNVQISKDVTILKGVTIGARSVIGAGSVVRKTIPPDSVVMGNPARVVMRLTPDDEKSGNV